MTTLTTPLTDALAPRHVEALLGRLAQLDDAALAALLGVPVESVDAMLAVAHRKLAGAVHALALGAAEPGARGG